MSSTIKFKFEDQLLLHCSCAHIEAHTVKKIKHLVKKDLNWDYLIDVASKHSLRSVLYFHLSRLCSEEVPLDIMGHLRNYHIFNVRKNLLMLGELLKILKLIKAEGIIAVPYKGPILSIDFYGDISLREFGDLDIFVDKKDVIKVKNILISSGYESNLDLDAEKEYNYLKFQREYKFTNKNNGLCIEIKWYLPLISLSFPKNLLSMNQIKTKIIEINNQEIVSFSDEDLLMILVLHSVSHLWSKMSLICDIAELIKNSNELDWNKVMESAHFMAIERILYLNLSLVNELFDIKLPKEVKLKIESDNKIEYLKQDVMKIIFENNYGLLHKIFLRLKIREKVINRLEDFIKVMIIPSSDEWKTFEKPLPLTLLYILNRPIQIFNKAINQE